MDFILSLCAKTLSVVYKNLIKIQRDERLVVYKRIFEGGKKKERKEERMFELL